MKTDNLQFYFSGFQLRKGLGRLLDYFGFPRKVFSETVDTSTLNAYQQKLLEKYVEFHGAGGPAFIPTDQTGGALLESVSHNVISDQPRGTMSNVHFIRGSILEKQGSIENYLKTIQINF